MPEIVNWIVWLGASAFTVGAIIHGLFYDKKDQGDDNGT